jgi:hypothetical protein
MNRFFPTALTVVGLALAGPFGCSEQQPPPTPPAPAPDAAAPDAPPPTPAPSPATPPDPEAPAAPPGDPVAPPHIPEPQPEPDIEPPTAPPPVDEEPQQLGDSIITDSGLIIEDLRLGTGEAVRVTDTIIVHYHGTLASGQVFDSTYERGEPTQLNVFQTIQGWQEGIPGMRVGGQRRLIVPPELGYGARARPNIPANSLLIFEIEVVEVVR